MGEDEEYIVEREVELKHVSKEVCERDLAGIYDEMEMSCRVKIREDLRKPGQIILIKLRPEEREIR